MATARTASVLIAEMREFASFTAAEQRYIKRSLDVGLARSDAFKVWARSPEENAAIRRQYVIYQDLKTLRLGLPSDTISEGMEEVMAKLIRLAAFDLSQERIESFSAMRFLYERLLGPAIRPWLPSAFCAAAALPQIRPERRKDLLQSLSEAAATAPGWSDRAPSFYPQHVALEAA